MMSNHYYKALLIALILPLAAPSPMAVAQMAAAQKPGVAAPPAPSPASPPACNRATFQPIIDVGHTLEAPGALSARGVTEYEFNLNVAKAIEQKLTAAGFSRTVLLVTSGPALQ